MTKHACGNYFTKILKDKKRTCKTHKYIHRLDLVVELCQLERESILNLRRRIVNLRRPERAQNKESTGPNGLRRHTM